MRTDLLTLIQTRPVPPQRRVQCLFQKGYFSLEYPYWGDGKIGLHRLRIWVVLCGMLKQFVFNYFPIYSTDQRLIRDFCLTIPSRSSPWHEKKSCKDVPQPAKKCSLGVQKILGVCIIEVIPFLFLVDRERIRTWSLSRHNLVSWVVTLPRRQSLFSLIK